MEIKETHLPDPFFSICIPQYNRTSFLLYACKILSEQSFKNFEICISDDKSTDGREKELIEYLRSSGLSFIYKQQEKNARYDANLRASIALAKGKYCFLHANDDCLSSSTVLQDVYEAVTQFSYPCAVITNFQFWDSGEKVHRVSTTVLAGTGPDAATTYFRNLSFVSGILFDRASAQQIATDAWDGSEMYQMYLFARLIASGKNLLCLDLSTIKKDVKIPKESVDSYASVPRIKPCPIIERKHPYMTIGQVIADAVMPYLTPANKDRVLESIFFQLYTYTFFFWIIEYRRVQSWKYALGVCLGMKPRNVMHGLRLKRLGTLRLHLLYAGVCAVGLSMPISLFSKLKPFLFFVSRVSMRHKTSANGA